MAKTNKEERHYSEVLNKIASHLTNNSIDLELLDTTLIAKLVTLLSGDEEISKSVLIYKLFYPNDVFDSIEIENYLSTAYIIGAVLTLPNPENFHAVVPLDTVGYILKTEAKATLAKDPSYTIHGEGYMSHVQLKKRICVLREITGQSYQNIIRQAKLELGMIEPEKPKKKKLKQNYPKKLGTENIENIIEKKPATTLESFVSDDYSPASKFVPSTPGKKRRQQQKPVYDESQLEKRVRQGIIAQTPRTQILDYLQKKMGCDNKTAEDFLIGIVYDSIKTALWAEKPAPKNTINYLSRGRQLELAKEYIIKNSIFETTGLRRLDSIKESLLRYLSIEEEKIDDLIDERREEYFENFEKEEPATIISEEPITINKNKQVIVTNHIQKRAYQRIGFGANNALFLIDLFHSGMSIAYSYDNNLHRIVEFAGKKYRMPYAETDDAYHLVTIIKIQKK